MVSDSQLVGRLREFLSTSDLNITTTAIVRRQLESDFGIDLSNKKAFIREQVDLYLQTQLDTAQGNEQLDNDGVGDGSIDEENGEAAEVKSEAEGSKSQEDDEEEGEGEEDEEEKESNNRKNAAKRGSKKPNKEVKKRGGGFTKLCSLSPKLQKLTGVPELARTEVVKQLWIYIRENNLQDPSNRRNIICDEKLRDIFGVNSINMFQMNKVLSKHIWPLDSDASVIFTSKEKKKKADREEDPDESERKEKRQKGGKSGILAPLPLSDALVKFLGTGENALPRGDVVKRMWEYIKQHNLQDASDKRRIICDEKLKELFNVDTFTGFGVSKLLTTHFIKAEQMKAKWETALPQKVRQQENYSIGPPQIRITWKHQYTFGMWRINYVVSS